MNPVLILTKNNLELTKRCVESVRAQDIACSIFVYDNESEDGTKEWLAEYLQENADICNLSSGVDLGVSAGWNFCLEVLFAPAWGAEYVLVLNNDVELPEFFYRLLENWNVPFVTGASVTSKAWVEPQPMPQAYEAPDFSAFLIRKEAWEKIGPFDEEMRLYYSDNSYHIRAHRLGITLWNSGIPFYHERSSTLRNADLFDRREMELQADRDKAEFKRLYGCTPRDPQYAELLK